MTDVVGNPKTLIVGLLGLAYSLWAFIGTWKDFDKMRRRNPMLTSWGGLRWPNFPGSRIGVLNGAAIGITLSSVLVFGFFESLSRLAIYCAVALVILLAASVPIAVRDYREHRRFLRIAKQRSGPNQS